MAELNKINAVLVPVEVAIEGIKIKFKVSPAEASKEEFRTELNKRSADIAEAESGNALGLRVDHSDYDFALASVVKSWDITDEGQPLAINEDTMKLLANPLKVEMWNAASEALAPKNLIRRTPRTSSQRGG